MPGEAGAPRSTEKLSQSVIQAGQSMCDGQPKEYFWACSLTTASNSYTWSTDEEEDDDDNDEDFLQHTLFLRHAVLGAGASSERHLVEIETKDFHGDVMKSPIFSLKMGLDEMVALDLNFPNGIPVTIRLIEGSGPVHISGQQLLEYPPEEEMDETAALTEDDVREDEEEEEEEEDGDEEGSEEEAEDDKKKPAVKSTKRKASVGKANKKAAKKGRRDGSDEDEDEEEEEEDPEESMDDDEDDDDYEEAKKSKKTKPKGKGARVVKKSVKEKPAAAGKKGKKAKA